MKTQKRLVTAALPYVNNVPHLGNLIQVLSADVYARYCRSAGFKTLYVCGTDEYGTATETKASALGLSPKELCDEFHKIHREIYQWFNISFDIFGRTSSAEHTQVVQDLFTQLDEAGYITQHTSQQFYCASCQFFLADRYIEGMCPHCQYEKAKGDQCEKCGQLLDPTDLIEPYCIMCQKKPDLKQTENLYINLPALKDKLVKWLDDSQIENFWPSNAVHLTREWLKKGLNERAITRDLKWGIPVPKEGFENKVFYVWFDAPIGYISLTKSLTADWKDWWQDEENTKLVQFVGKDNISFHSILFPSLLLGTKEKWTMVKLLSSSEYLNYENSKFSKSSHTGVFGDDVQKTGIDCDMWRYYLMCHRPEKADTSFLWHDFQERINADLIGNLGNFVNRTLSFYYKFFGQELEEFQELSEIWSPVRAKEVLAIEALEAAHIKGALAHILSICDQANKQIQEYAPWKRIKEEPNATKIFLSNWIYVIRNLAILIEPYLPNTAGKIFQMLNLKTLSIQDLEKRGGIIKISQPQILFRKLESEYINTLKSQFGGAKETNLMQETSIKEETKQVYFDQNIALSVMQIIKVEKHPEADKLFILELKEDEESLKTRTIVSGLVGIYSESELLDKKIIVVENLKKTKLRGTESQGMLTAVSSEEDHDDCEVLMADSHIPLGTRLVTYERINASLDTSLPTLKAQKFFACPIFAQEGYIFAQGEQLYFHKIGTPVSVKRIKNGPVG
ncbi:UNVERIFIED_CONTAM: hypothetical protein PYX00_011217 [Menopon gallinae]|uniref:Methionine--tRNA ligase, cytoplasmic n=1 Tax=Menopon gallinae TaxID=328185 RepID=A0AAW2H6J2_9NEOP